MAKVQFLGYNPTLFLKGQKQEAAHFRSWQFLDGLVSAGHQVMVCAAESPAEITIPTRWQSAIEYQQIPYRKYGWARRVQSVHNAFQPDCIVAANWSQCVCLTRLNTNVPIWMDIYGDPLTIMQAAAYRARSERGIVTAILFMLQTLQKGDQFSVCGTPQKHLLIGELAMAGRLNAKTFGFDFGKVILPGVPPRFGARVEGNRPLLAELDIHDGDFAVLWCGGYNTWTDVKTLFEGLERAMKENARIHFVSIGASTYQAQDNVYEHFQALVKGSLYSQRYHFLGWQPWEKIPPYYAECDCGINIDAIHAETIYGTRTRLTEMMAAGLTPVTSLGAELSYLIRDHGLGLTFEPGDPAGLATCLLNLSHTPDEVRARSERCLEYATTEFSFQKTTQPLLEWVEHPCKAPDHHQRTLGKWIREQSYLGRAVMRQLTWRLF